MTPPPNPPVDRRNLLRAGVASAVIGLSSRVLAQQPPAALPAEGESFDRTTVVELARSISKRPYVAPNAALPDWLSGLNFEQYSAIRNRADRNVWAEAQKGFVLEPLHRGFIYQAPVQLFVVEGGKIRRLVYSTQRYDLGRLTPPPTVGDIGFSGVRIVRTAGETAPREVATFQGASFIKAAARFQASGVVARALSLKTADPRGEEFPFFKAFWIEQPTADDVIIVHALLDSESVAGAYTFTIRVGEVTFIDTEAAIFPRVLLDNVGFAGMQATYLFGANDRRGIDDYRPAVYEVSGLQMVSGVGEWIWRPVTNPRQLQISAFMDENPRGFGFVQRDRDFAQFQDHEARFESRPTLWIEPIGDWRAGNVQLVEIPSDNEIHDNILAQWRPKEPLQPGSEHFIAYRQHWCWTPPDRPPVAIVVGTRTGRTSQQRRRRFVVDFAGEKLAATKPEDISANFWASNNGLNNVRLIHGVGGKLTRVAFDLETGNENLIELRLNLKSGETPVSETWLYRWTP